MPIINGLTLDFRADEDVVVGLWTHPWPMGLGEGLHIEWEDIANQMVGEEVPWIIFHHREEGYRIRYLEEGEGESATFSSNIKIHRDHLYCVGALFPEWQEEDEWIRGIIHLIMVEGREGAEIIYLEGIHLEQEAGNI